MTGKRLAEFLDPPSRTRIILPDGLDPNPMMKVFTAPAVDALAAETAQWRAAELGALNAHGNARSVARILSALALGGRSGSIRLLSAAVASLPFVEQTRGIGQSSRAPLPV